MTRKFLAQAESFAYKAGKAVFSRKEEMHNPLSLNRKKTLKNMLNFRLQV